MKAMVVARVPNSVEQCDRLVGDAMTYVAIVMHRIDPKDHDKMLEQFVKAVKETYAKSEVIGVG